MGWTSADINLDYIRTAFVQNFAINDLKVYFYQHDQAFCILIGAVDFIHSNFGSFFS